MIINEQTDLSRLVVTDVWQIPTPALADDFVVMDLAIDSDRQLLIIPLVRSRGFLKKF